MLKSKWIFAFLFCLSLFGSKESFGCFGGGCGGETVVVIQHSGCSTCGFQPIPQPRPVGCGCQRACTMCGGRGVGVGVRVGRIAVGVNVGGFRRAGCGCRRGYAYRGRFVIRSRFGRTVVRSRQVFRG